MKLTFFGAAKAVTGSCHCVEVRGKKILIDCGLQQGGDVYNENELFFDATAIDAVCVTHAHTDHSGRLPLMVTENCVTRCSVGCTHGAGSVLTDRTGARFPVLCGYGCRCEIQNSKTLFLADKPEIRHCGLTYGRLRFTTETPEQCVQVLQRYQNGGNWTPEDLTRGLFYRGVE